MSRSCPPAEFEGQFPSPAPRRWDVLHHQLHHAHKPKASRLSLAEVQTEINAYDAAIASLDQRVGELLDQLDRRGLLDSTVVFITSDHGEPLGEHGKWGHGDDLYRFGTQVPLLVLQPDRRSAVVDDFVSLRNVATTALDVAGIVNDGAFPSCSFGRVTKATRFDGGAAAAGCWMVTAELPNHGEALGCRLRRGFPFYGGAEPPRAALRLGGRSERKPRPGPGSWASGPGRPNAPGD